MKKAEYDSVAVGQRLKKTLKDQNVTTRDVAMTLKVRIDFVGKILRGERNLTVPNLLLLYQHYDIDFRYILTGEDDALNVLKEANVKYNKSELSQREILLLILEEVQKLTSD